MKVHDELFVIDHLLQTNMMRNISMAWIVWYEITSIEVHEIHS